jgi:hypothetical protein
MNKWKYIWYASYLIAVGILSTPFFMYYGFRWWIFPLAILLVFIVAIFIEAITGSVNYE